MNPVLTNTQNFNLYNNFTHNHSFLFYDTEAHIRLVFQVKEPQDLILIKMSALFSFAASQHFKLINNEFFPK